MSGHRHRIEVPQAAQLEGKREPLLTREGLPTFRRSQQEAYLARFSLKLRGSAHQRGRLRTHGVL